MAEDGAVLLDALVDAAHEADLVVRLREGRPQQVQPVLGVEVLVDRVHGRERVLARGRLGEDGPGVALQEDLGLFARLRADLAGPRRCAARVPLAVPQLRLAGRLHLDGHRAVLVRILVRAQEQGGLDELPGAPSGAGRKPWRSRRRPGSGSRSSRRAGPGRCRTCRCTCRRSPARASCARRRVASPSSQKGITSSKKATSPVSLTYSQIEGMSHRWSSEQVSLDAVDVAALGRRVGDRGRLEPGLPLLLGVEPVGVEQVQAVARADLAVEQLQEPLLDLGRVRVRYGHHVLARCRGSRGPCARRPR